LVFAGVLRITQDSSQFLERGLEEGSKAIWIGLELENPAIGELS
jgi:hypothetical protein